MMKKIFGWFGKKDDLVRGSSNIMASLINKLAITEEYEISCDDVHEILDQFTELEMRGEDVPILMPLVQKHLDLCPDCGEEHEVLLRALEFEKHIDE